MIIDEEGRARRIGKWVDGKKDGLWRLYVKDRLITEVTYDDGRAVRRVMLDAEGIAYHDSRWSDDIAHGRFRARELGEDFFVEGEFTQGRRSGTWRRLGGGNESWTYGDDGVLLTFNGRALPPPSEAIVLPNGTTLERSSCRLAKYDMSMFLLRSPCFDLFEAFQRCALEPDGDACRERAFAEYAKH